MAEIRTLIGDCLSVLDSFPEGRFDLIYLDPPFFTQKEQVLTTHDGKATYSFSDIWKSHNEYACFLYDRLLKLHRVFASTGSLFFIVIIKQFIISSIIAGIARYLCKVDARIHQSLIASTLYPRRYPEPQRKIEFVSRMKKYQVFYKILKFSRLCITLA